jgi:predicted homoserine dehydrogenase-like protein
VEVARVERLLPLGLAKGCVLKRAVQRDAALSYDDIESVPETVLLRMRERQDQSSGLTAPVARPGPVPVSR